MPPPPPQTPPPPATKSRPPNSSPPRQPSSSPSRANITSSGSELSSPPDSLPHRSRATRSSSSTISSRPSLDALSSSSSSTQTSASALSESSSESAFCQPRTIRHHGVVFDAWKPVDRLDAPVMGDAPRRALDGSVEPRSKREREVQEEEQWQKKRKLAITERVFDEDTSSAYRSDQEGVFHFEGETLPEWLHAVREYQDDGAPGTYLISPSREDFENRWREILDAIRPFGMRLGIIKVKVPEECVDKPVPYIKFLDSMPPVEEPEKPPPSPPPPPPSPPPPPPPSSRKRKSRTVKTFQPGVRSSVRRCAKRASSAVKSNDSATKEDYSATKEPEVTTTKDEDSAGMGDGLATKDTKSSARLDDATTEGHISPETTPPTADASTLATEPAPVTAERPTTGPAAEPATPEDLPPPEPMVYTMTQFLPLHRGSKHLHGPIFEVISKNKKQVSISTFKHQLTAASPNHRIPEETMLLRGRIWKEVMQDNPGGEVYYSSDNDATPELRSFLGLADPKLAALDGNLMFDSTEMVIGIHTPYLYLGNPYTLFALHQEDYCALSLNYHHTGAPKMWRVTCPRDFDRVEQLVRRVGDVARDEKVCSQHVRHASVFLSKGALELEQVRSILVRQKRGEMVVTWPLSYHQGWNEGANVCEAIAYGNEVWRDTFVGKMEKGVYRACGKKCVQRGMGVPIELKFEGEKKEEQERDGQEGDKQEGDE